MLLVLNLIRHIFFYFIYTFNKSKIEVNHIRGKLLHSFFLSMGPVYIKIGQVLSTRSDLFPPEIIIWLQKLQDDVPSMKQVEFERVIKQFQKHKKIIKEISTTPVASASIAQVHRAILVDGTIVAIKIVKNGVKSSLKTNLKILSQIIFISDFVMPKLRPLQLKTRFKDFERLLLGQLDMNREANDMEGIRNNFENHPFLYIPKPFKNLSNSNLLVMEYVEGIPGKKVVSGLSGLKSIDMDCTPSKLVYRLIEVLFTMIYMDGYFHADPHPGNFLFTNKGKLNLLDFGIVERLTESEKWYLSSFYYAVIRKEWQIALERFTRCFVVASKELYDNWDIYKKEMISCLREHFETVTNTWNTSEFTRSVVTILTKYNAKEKTNWTKIELALVSIEGFITQIDPSVDLWELSKKFNERYSLYLSDKLKIIFDKHHHETIPLSLKLEKEADNILVAPTHLHRYFLPAHYPLFFKEAKGCILVDVDGNEYVELHGGYGPYILGYGHHVVKDAIAEASKLGSVCALGNLYEIKLMKLIVDAIPSAQKGIFCNSGTEGCHIAISLCKAFTKKDVVAKCEGHYHGFSDQGTVSSWFRVDGELDDPIPIAGSAGVSKSIVSKTVVLQYGHPKSVEKIINNADKLACVILEPMPASMLSYDKKWLISIHDVCSKYKIPLVFDEVVTGFRIGYGGVQELVGINPDLTVLGKIIGGGLPCGAVVGCSKIIDMAKSTLDAFRDWETKVFTGGTLSGNTLSCAAGAAQVNYLRKNMDIYERLDNNMKWLMNELKNVINKHGIICKVNGVGSLFTLNFRFRKPKYYREKFSGSNFKANVALAYYMRKYNIYMAELHTYFISAAHTLEHLQKVVESFDLSIEIMLNEGIINSYKN